MMKKFYPFLILPVFAFALFLMSNSSGSPGGKSGSPGDEGSTCTSCHTGTATSATGWITTDIPEEGYTPGETYTITLTGTHTGVGKFGFEATVEDESENKVGTLAVVNSTETKLVNGNNAVTHKSTGTTPSGDSKTWTVEWTAPEAGTGEIGIYAAFNAANGTGSTAGDVIYNTSLFISEYVLEPALVSISPSQADQGESFSASILAENTSWTEDPGVILINVNDDSETYTATNVSVESETELSGDFDILEDATPGMYHLMCGELMLDNSFEVIEVVLEPALLSITPSEADQGEMLTVTVMGENTNWIDAPVVKLINSDDEGEFYTATNVSVQSETELMGNFEISMDATPGLYNLMCGELMLDNSFEVIEVILEPALISITPSEANQGDSFMATVIGDNTNWMDSPVVQLINVNDDMEVYIASNVVVSSETELTADFDISMDATPGLYHLKCGDLMLENSFEVKSTVGLENYVFAGISIYPNPTSDFIRIKNAQNAMIEIYSITGAMMTSTIGQSDLENIDLSGYDNGIYMVRLIKDGDQLTKKITVR